MRVVYHLSLAVMAIAVLVLTVWSWALVDPNFTLVAHADWTAFRNQMVALGRENRPLSMWIYMISLVSLLVSTAVLTLKPTISRTYLWIVLGIGGLIALVSYPALSHDLFNYIFDAKIFTVYGQNPYLKRAMDFPIDQDLRFMHWIHRTYPYGPSYLAMSLLPSYMSMGKFTAAFASFKLWHLLAYAHSVLLLSRLSRRQAFVFAISPLVLIEGLMNTHNDFIAVWLGIVGMYLIVQKRPWLALGAMILSGLIKYFTLPLVIIPIGLLASTYLPQARLPTFDRLVHIAFFGMCFLIGWVWWHSELHPWYLLNLVVLLPFIPRSFSSLFVFLQGSLLSYYPYVLGGEWGQGGDVGFKKQILLTVFLANIVGLALYSLFSIRTRHHASSVA